MTMARMTKATLVQEAEHLRRMLALEIQTSSLLRGEIEKLKAARVSSFRNSEPAPRRFHISEIGKLAAAYCETHNVKSVTRAQLLEELRA
jgi:hypothetical protein